MNCSVSTQKNEEMTRLDAEATAKQQLEVEDNESPAE